MQKTDYDSLTCAAPCDCNCPTDLQELTCGTGVTVANPCTLQSVTAYIQDCGPTQTCRSAFGCKSYVTHKFDLTPCTFTAIGGDLSAGYVDCNVTWVHPC